MKKRRNYFIPFVLLVFAAGLSVPLIKGEDAANFLLNPLTWIVGFVVLFLIITSFAVNAALESIKYYVLKRDGKLDELLQQEVSPETEDWFARMWKKLQDAKPIERESEIELDHEYDGIRELDNNLPPWWLYGFYLSIVFAVIYLFRYHIAQTAPLQTEEYKQAMAAAAVQKEAYLKNAANLVDETNVVMLTDQALIKEGAAIFKANCAVCHAADGGGGVGPNLTDAYWLHGGSIAEIFSTIKYGVPAKGMIPWKDQLNPAQTQKVASFIMHLQGSSPADPKEKQGELYIPALAPEQDSTSPDSSEIREVNQ
jgi:cytochrome c oxidase cbb3-type subunit 3